MKKMIKKYFDQFEKDIKKPGNIILFSIATIVLSILVIQQRQDRARVLENPIETKGEILRIKPCYKNGKCMEYQYQYKDSIYKREASISWAFAKWCENRNDCKGMQFRVLVEKNNPNNVLVYWEEMFEEAKQASK
jgi:hypothetical protein